MARGGAKVIAVSKDRYTASAAERRRYGGNIVTEFYVYEAADKDDASKWKVITGYGKTAADRKRDAIARFEAAREGNPKVRNVAAMVLGRVYAQSFGSDNVYFLPTAPTKTGWKGIQVSDYGRNRKAIKSSVPGTSLRLWRELASGDVPPAIHERFFDALPQANPKVRYTVVPVDYTGDHRVDEVFLVRGGRRDSAIRKVARDVDGETLIDLGETRTHPTKHEAMAQANGISPKIRELANRLARGEN